MSGILSVDLEQINDSQRLLYFMYENVIFLGTNKAGSGLRDTETQVASCETASDSENICTYSMALQQVK